MCGPAYAHEHPVMKSEQERCENCRFYGHDTAGIPSCLRHAPVANEDKWPYWPHTYRHQWCGDWQAANSKGGDA